MYRGEQLFLNIYHFEKKKKKREKITYMFSMLSENDYAWNQGYPGIKK